METKRWKSRTGEPIAFMRVQISITPTHLLMYAAELFTQDENGRLVDVYGKEITRKSLEQAIRDDFCTVGDRMDWTADDDNFPAAVSAVTRIYPEWADDIRAAADDIMEAREESYD